MAFCLFFNVCYSDRILHAHNVTYLQSWHSGPDVLEYIEGRRGDVGTDEGTQSALAALGHKWGVDIKPKYLIVLQVSVFVSVSSTWHTLVLWPKQG